MTLRAPPDLPTDPTDEGMDLTDWRLLLEAAEERAAKARQRAQDALDREARTQSPTSHLDAATARRVAQNTERLLLYLWALWDTTARPDALLHVRLEQTRWRDDGATVTLHDKGKGDGGKETRLGFLIPATAARLRTWRADLEPDGRLPREGWLFPGLQRTRPWSLQATEEALHELALEAGVQRYRPGGRTKKSHRFVVTPAAVRVLAELAAIGAGAPRLLAARAAGHTKEIQERHYGRAGADIAKAVALARADVVHRKPRPTIQAGEANS